MNMDIFAYMWAAWPNCQADFATDWNSKKAAVTSSEKFHMADCWKYLVLILYKL